MIKKMRYQFILVTMGCISFIFLLILSVINISMTISSRNQGYALLERISEAPKNKDFPFPSEKEADPPHGNPVDGFSAFRSFSVHFDSDGEIDSIHYNEDSDLDEETIRSLAMEVFAQGSSHDRGVSSKYLYLIKKDNNNTDIFFLDYSLEKNLSLRLFWTCLYIGLIGIVFIFILVIVLSRWIVKPVQTAFERQKQFIADASHELKTPLTIITTNAEVLSATLKDNKWLQHILAQTKRMSTLIKNLLELAKLDAYEETYDFAEFDLSKSVQNAALSFESIAFEYGKTYTIDIDEGISLYGNENSLKQLTTILLDNAFKYSEENGSVSIGLKQQGDKRILTVRNTGKGIPTEDQQKIFERFYRSDASRSRESGGYGLGLSIAESIVKLHKGQITVKSDADSYSYFTVILPGA